MLQETVLDKSLNVIDNIDRIELLNDIMGMEAKAEVIFSQMRSRAVSGNYPGVLNYFDELNFILNHYQNKYSDLSKNKKWEYI